MPSSYGWLVRKNRLLCRRSNLLCVGKYVAIVVVLVVVVVVVVTEALLF